MNALYRVVGISKQGFHKHLDRYLSMQDEQHQLLGLILQIRTEYPSLSARQMYWMIRPVHLGRDRFEALCFENGFKIERKVSFRRTTNSMGVTRFPNLLLKRELKGINLVWVSDITYYQIEDQFYYLTFIMDLYSRRIVGYSASETLLTEQTTLPAIRKALGCRKIPMNLIFHTDGGGQYYCKEFIKLIRKHGIQSSMAETVYENPNAERLNGLIKNDYLIHYAPQDFIELQRELRRAVRNYNLKPRNDLGKLSPIDFEIKCRNMEDSPRKKANQTSELGQLTIAHISDILATATSVKNKVKTVNLIQA